MPASKDSEDVVRNELFISFNCTNPVKTSWQRKVSYTDGQFAWTSDHTDTIDQVPFEKKSSDSTMTMSPKEAGMKRSHPTIPWSKAINFSIIKYVTRVPPNYTRIPSLLFQWNRTLLQCTQMTRPGSVRFPDYSRWNQLRHSSGCNDQRTSGRCSWSKNLQGPTIKSSEGEDWEKN